MNISEIFELSKNKSSEKINDKIVYFLNNCMDQKMIDLFLMNIQHHKFILEQKSKKVYDDQITIFKNIRMHSTSSSLLQKNDKYLMNIRYVSYYIMPNGMYAGVYEANNKLITLNRYIEFDKEFNIIRNEYFGIDYDNSIPYIGLEDVRLFDYKNELYYIGVSYHKDRNNVGVTYGKYTSPRFTDINEIHQKFNDRQCEKNWVFVIYKKELLVIYDWHPIRLCRIHKKEIIVVKTIDTPNIFRYVRNSSCGFYYNDEIWFITHVVSCAEMPRHYYHMIVVCDTDMNVKRYSAPFKFEGDPIEYSLSIIINDDEVLINYSNWDRTTRIGVYNKTYIDSILIYQ